MPDPRTDVELLSEDDQNLRDMTLEELEAAWDLWFDLAQHTNQDDPPYTHGVFQGVGGGSPAPGARRPREPGPFRGPDP